MFEMPFKDLKISGHYLYKNKMSCVIWVGTAETFYFSFSDANFSAIGNLNIWNWHTIYIIQYSHDTVYLVTKQM